MNLDEYFERICFKGPVHRADLDTLNRVHMNHVLSIPFENLSIHCSEWITMDLDVIYDKIVRKGRGGWCCENNLLFSWVLKQLGYTFTMLGSRVFNSSINQFSNTDTHLINKVDIDGVSYIADVSFGVSGQIWHPLELILGKEQPQEPGVFRFVQEEGMWVLEKTGRKRILQDESFNSSDLLGSKSKTKKFYSFTLTPRDLNYFLETSNILQTSSDSLFKNKSICSLQTPTGFRALVGWTYSEVIYNFEEGADLVDMKNIPDHEIQKVLKDKFNISLENKFIPVNSKGCYTL
ncbi:arylamine N-acetyltransferase, pineal gland isozyme NAT-10-like [Scleropages formosus]|uniref:arylamine N-acetyltransferase, pineal gland isozyme NAT-10-like n=1 Tax=Scleropages formosus TaxID=113540 RepID=UPI0010FAB2C9|nr:arylamine N-acetyltransferase, pineal gland isozyme NAT-10-like [Scleropages formosus]